jgi:hypothetical protein
MARCITRNPVLRGRELSKAFDPDHRVDFRATMTIFSRLWELFYIFLLLTNAVAVLNEERFLARSELTWLLMTQGADDPPYCVIGNLLEIVGWSSSQAAQQTYNGYEQTAEEGIKSRLVYLITAIRTLLRSEHAIAPYPSHSHRQILTVPLIAINVIVIVYELVLGG